MEEAFVALLRGSAAVIAIAPATSINFGAHPQGTPLPGIVLNVVSDFESMTMQGPDGLSQGRVQADCYADTYTQAKQLSRAVRAALSGYRGGGFRLVEHVATRDSREGGTNEADRPFRASLDFMTHWRES
jgi:hypothetical protein